MTYIPEDEYAKILAWLPILCVDCLISHEGKCLLLRRTNEPAKGQYWFPGGRICKNETIRDAALRKVREEVGLDCNFENVISIEETMFAQVGGMACDIHTVNICCLLTTSTPDNVMIDTFHDDYIWANIEQALELKVHAGVINPMKKYL
jgi:ADP-ribose pyrophosphatase YjhB (NUDIX family)